MLHWQDVEKDYNPKDLAKFLLCQNPELLQQNVSIQPALNRSVFYLCVIKHSESVVCTCKHLEEKMLNLLVGLLSVDYDAEESLLPDEYERPLSQGELRKTIMKRVSATKSALIHSSNCLLIVILSTFLIWFSEYDP